MVAPVHIHMGFVPTFLLACPLPASALAQDQALAGDPVIPAAQDVPSIEAVSSG